LYSTAQLRDRGAVARGVLKVLIGLYLDHAPERVELRSGRFGKPFLVGAIDDPDLQFSLAHSNHIAVYAFAKDRPIGVDVEEVRALADWEGVVGMCLSAYETEWFSRTSPARKAETFYRLWTIKEAYLKATGTGLSVPPSDIEVRAPSKSEYQFYRIEGEVQPTRSWKIAPFAVSTTFPASLVVADGPTDIKSFCWEPSRLLKTHSLCSSQSRFPRITC
jgi:4'-phosphopantetheinyl transferase